MSHTTPHRRTTGEAGHAGALLVRWLLVGLVCGATVAHAAAQEPHERSEPLSAAEPDRTKAGPASADALAGQQRQLSERFKRLEEVLLRMAELSGPSDPRRAALLRKAVAQSKEEMIGLQFEQLVQLLEKDQLSRALENQGELQVDLKGLLELLMSENRSKRIESEKARLGAYLKQINQLIRQQRSVHGRTGGSDDSRPLATEQGQLADKTGRLGKEMKAYEEDAKPVGEEAAAAKSAPKTDSPSVPESQPQAPGAKKPSPEQGKPEPSGGKPADAQAPKPGEGQPPPGQSQAAPSGDQEQPSQPARPRVEAAEQRMRQAQQRLAQAQRKEALEEQEAALRELEQAKADLERILRQLREEEMQRVLALLEARFLKMLHMQREVLEGTVRLDKVPEEDRTHNHEIESGRLSTREVEIVVEADKALLLLREDGTAAAFPEAVVQVRQDMQQVVQRLAEGKVNSITQSLEEEIVAALEEMIEAFKQAQKKLDDQRQKQGPQGGDPNDMAIVDALAELKMIRTLQMRVNTRTQRYSKLIQGEQTESAELLEALRRLAEREERIHQITRDLELGKNR